MGTVQRVAWCVMLMNTSLACHEVGRYRVVDLSPDAADPLGYSFESNSTVETTSSPRLGGGGRTGRNFGAAAPSIAASEAGADVTTAVEAPLSTAEALEDIATSGEVDTVVSVVLPLDTETSAGSTDTLGTGAPNVEPTTGAPTDTLGTGEPNTGVLDTGTSSTTGNSPTTAGATDTLGTGTPPDTGEPNTGALDTGTSSTTGNSPNPAGATDTGTGTSTSTTPSLVTEPVVPDDTPVCDIDAGADCAPDAQAVAWCQADAECGNDAPFCVDEVCVECEVDEDCDRGSASVCDVGRGVCVD